MMNLLWKPRGTIYTAVLNFRGELDRLGEAMHQDPYKIPPRAPVLFIKPPNTWVGAGDVIPCPRGVPQLRMGGTLAIVMGTHGQPDGFTIANDVSIPHESYYRPPIAQRCRDGFCPVFAEILPLADPDGVEIRVRVNGHVKAVNNTRNLVRGIARLIHDISEFMTLRAGDVLLVGEPENSPLASIGDVVRVEIDGLGFLENAIGAENPQ